MTCKTNEAVALNTEKVEEFVTKNGIVTIKADKTHDRPDIDKLLVELGNVGEAIPFYAVYPGNGGAPITFDGLITQQTVLDALQQAGPSRGKGQQEVAEAEPAAAPVAR